MPSCSAIAPIPFRDHRRVPGDARVTLARTIDRSP